MRNRLAQRLQHFCGALGAFAWLVHNPAQAQVVEWGSTLYPRPAALTNVVAVAVGNDHALALQENGSVVGWGFNSSGRATLPGGVSNVIVWRI